MKVIAINGGPRKGWNTEILLTKALEGAATAGAETELIHLYDINYHGCRSCFACKRIEHISTECVIKDELTNVLKKAMESDVILLGSPIYLGDVTGAMRSFMERLLYPCVTYEAGQMTNFKGKINSGIIYTMNMPKIAIKFVGYPYIFKNGKKYFKRLNGVTEYMLVTDTYQFTDYSKYQSSRFNAKSKAKRKEKQFPIDCQKAFELGRRLAEQAKSND